MPPTFAFMQTTRPAHRSASMRTPASTSTLASGKPDAANYSALLRAPRQLAGSRGGRPFDTAGRTIDARDFNSRGLSSSFRQAQGRRRIPERRRACRARGGRCAARAHADGRSTSCCWHVRRSASTSSRCRVPSAQAIGVVHSCDARRGWPPRPGRRRRWGPWPPSGRPARSSRWRRSISRAGSDRRADRRIGVGIARLGMVLGCSPRRCPRSRAARATLSSLLESSAIAEEAATAAVRRGVIVAPVACAGAPQQRRARGAKRRTPARAIQASGPRVSSPSASEPARILPEAARPDRVSGSRVRARAGGGYRLASRA